MGSWWPRVARAGASGVCWGYHAGEWWWERGGGEAMDHTESSMGSYQTSQHTYAVHEQKGAAAANKHTTTLSTNAAAVTPLGGPGRSNEGEAETCAGLPSPAQEYACSVIS